MIRRTTGTVQERQRRDVYTPVWTSSGTAPAIGNGTITGLFSVTDDEVHVVINVVFGSTSTYGTGFWSFSLPFLAHGSLVQSLDGYVTDTSVPNYLGVKWVVGAGQSVAGGGLLTYQVNTPSNLVGVGTYSWATGDSVYISGLYFAAL